MLMTTKNSKKINSVSTYKGLQWWIKDLWKGGWTMAPE